MPENESTNQYKKFVSDAPEPCLIPKASFVFAINCELSRPPNVLNMVPFAVGDEIEFSGIKRGSEYICYSIVVVNLEITTNAAFNDPVYIRVEEALIGVFDASTNTEFADIRVCLLSLTYVDTAY